jgi:hypothetical protein
MTSTIVLKEQLVRLLIFARIFCRAIRDDQLSYLPTGINCPFHVVKCLPLWFWCLLFSRLVHFCAFCRNRPLFLLFTSALFLPLLILWWRDAHLFNHQIRTGICEWTNGILLHGFQYCFSCTFVHTIPAISRFQMGRYRSGTEALKSLLFGIGNNLFVNGRAEFCQVGFDAAMSAANSKRGLR